MPAEVKEDITYKEYRAMKEQGNQQDSPEEPLEQDPDEDVESEEKPDSTAGESSDPETEIPEEEPELYNGKPPTESQKRFKQLFGEYTPKDLAARRKEAEESRAALEARLRVIEQSPRQPERQTEAPKPETFRARPKLDDFKTVEEWQSADTQWIEDRDEWKDQQRRKREQAETQHRQVQTQQQKAMAQIEEGRKAFRDFDIIFTAPISDTIANELVDDPDGYKVAYQLAKNPSEARRISALPPNKQLLALGQFMASNSKPQAKKNTQPLKTPSKLSSGGGAQIDATEKRIREIVARANKMR